MTNDSESDSFFNNDLPITEVSEDRLERAKLAGKLADDIQGYFNSTDDKHKERRKESFVIGILGKWGEGKTSFINLVRKKLKGENNKTEYDLPQTCKILGCRAIADIEVLRWDPWYFSTKTDLGQQLYELIRPKCKLLACEWFVFFILLPFLVALGCFRILQCLDLLDHPTIFLTIFGIAFVVLSELYKKYPKNKFAAKYPFFSDAILKKIFSLFKDPINSFIEHHQYNFDETKSSLKEVTKDRKLLIVIDDVDRMAPVQIKQIFDLLKGIGNLPNTVYLIAFDKIVVSNAINTHNPTEGEKYLDKIINCQIPLYYNYNDLLKQYIVEELKVRASSFSIPSELENVISNLREIKQLTSSIKEALSFIKNSIKNDNSNAADNQLIFLQDIDIKELLCIRAILLHNKAIYDLISTNKEILIASDFKKNEDYQKRLINFKESINKLSQSYALKQLVDFLFPIESQLKQDNISDLMSIGRERKATPGNIDHPNYFEIFFTLTYPKYLVNSNQYSLLLQQDNQNQQGNIYQIISEFIKDLSLIDKYRWLEDFGQKLELLKDAFWIREEVNFNIENITYYVVAIAKIAGHQLLEHVVPTFYSDLGDPWSRLKQVFRNLLKSHISTEIPPINVDIILDSIKEEQDLTDLPITCMFLTLKNELTGANLSTLLPVLISNVLQRFEALTKFFLETIISLCTHMIREKEKANFAPPDNFAQLIDRIKNELKSNDDLFLRFMKFSLQNQDTNITIYAKHYINLSESLKRLTDMQDNPKYSDDDNKKLIDISIKVINNYLKNKNKEPL